MKRPSFQFYPADWRNNAKLRRCTEAARGAWTDILCILHDSDEYGVLRWPLDDIARAAGVSIKSARELAQKEVIKGGDAGMEAFTYTTRHAGQDGNSFTLIEKTSAPCWYSSRMVIDEFIRLRRGVGTRFTTENQPPTKSPTRRVGVDIGESSRSPTRAVGDGLGDGPSSSSSSSSSKESICASASPSTAARFKKPEMPELELYASKLALPVLEIRKFVDYYESNGWRVGRNPMKSWQAAMRNWKNNMQVYRVKASSNPDSVGGNF
jgi:hypothetical protein